MILTSFDRLLGIPSSSFILSGQIHSLYRQRIFPYPFVCTLGIFAVGVDEGSRGVAEVGANSPFRTVRGLGRLWWTRWGYRPGSSGRSDLFSVQAEEGLRISGPSFTGALVCSQSISLDCNSWCLEVPSIDSIESLQLDPHDLIRSSEGRRRISGSQGPLSLPPRPFSEQCTCNQHMPSAMAIVSVTQEGSKPIHPLPLFRFACKQVSTRL